jgi:hypothetical protein
MNAEAELQGFIEAICTEPALTSAGVRDATPQNILSGTGTKSFTKNLISLSRIYRTRGQLGRLRACIFVGAVLCGKRFITKAEREALLLPTESSTRKFRRFLFQFHAEIGVGEEDDVQLLRHRLESYIAYDQFKAALDPSLSKGEAVLQERPRYAIKSVLALTHLHFLCEKLHFPFGLDLSEFFDQFDSPEDMASAASILVASANDIHTLDSLDFALPFSEEIASDEIRSVITCGNTLSVQLETAKLISLFGYNLSQKEPGLFYLSPPSTEFEYAWRLGLMRAEIGASNISVFEKNQEFPAGASIIFAAKMFVDALGDKLGKVLGAGTLFERIPLNIPIIPTVYQKMIGTTFVEDIQYREVLSQDFLLPLDLESEEFELTEHLNIGTFYEIWQFFRLMAAVDVLILWQHSESTPRAVLNSLVRVYKEEEIFSLIEGLGFTEQQIREFFELISADVRDLGYFDIQYRPFLRIAANRFVKGDEVLESPAEMVGPPGLVLLSNILRNLQTSNRLRFRANADAFVEIVARMLKTKFDKVEENRRLQLDQRVTDVDVVLCEGTTLYLIECKHSVPGASIHEMRDVWEDIERAAEQLAVAMTILNEPHKRQDYLAGWFPGTKIDDTAGIRIQPCILSSHREFSGLEYEGIPVRDFSSLSLLFGDASVGMGSLDENGTVNMYRYKIIKDGGPTQADLDNYLSAEASYFKTYEPFMQPVTRIKSLAEGKVRLASETFRLELELGQWMEHLDQLGFEKEPVERKELKRPFDFAQAMGKLALTSSENATVPDSSEAG